VSHRPGDVNPIFYRFAHSLTDAAPGEPGYHILLFSLPDPAGDLRQQRKLIPQPDACQIRARSDRHSQGLTVCRR
jgi:hypothetical protein